MSNTYPECKFYLKGGRCSHVDAPNPNHSYCIGKEACEAWQDTIKCKASRVLAKNKAE